MYEFTMPSNLVKKGDPLPEMPAGLGSPLGSNPSMQPDQIGSIQSMMSNYNQAPMNPNTGQSSLFNGTIPQQIQSFGMPQPPVQKPKNMNPVGGNSLFRSNGPAFFTI